MDDLQRFQAAEDLVFAHYGLRVRNTYLELPRPRPNLRVRVIEAGNGPPVLLMHGGLGYASMWAPLMAALPDYRLLAVDRPGYGLTDPFEHRRGGLRDDAVSFLDGVISALGVGPVPVIANSMGGLWTFWTALDRPQAISAICQLGCPALLLDTSAPAPMRMLSVRGLNRALVRWGPHRTPQDRFRDIGEEDAVDTLPAAFLDCLDLASRLPGWWPASLSLLEAAVRLRGARVPLCADELRRIAQPTRFVWGGRDPFGPVEAGHRAVELMPSADLVTLDAGHGPWLSRPQETADAVRSHLTTVAAA
jgi:pimeloyl-ACP methyl ester carboxylesterase